MSKWRTMLKTFNKVAAMLLSLQLVLSPLAPVFLTQPVFAQETDLEAKTQYDLEYLAAENELRVEVGDETELPFGIYYYDEIDGQVEAAEGKLTAEDHSIYFGTCSDGICTADEASRGVLKVRVGDKITALKFELIEEEVGLVEKHDSDEMGLSEDELGWVEGMKPTFENIASKVIDHPGILGLGKNNLNMSLPSLATNLNEKAEAELINENNKKKGWPYVEFIRSYPDGRIELSLDKSKKPGWDEGYTIRLDGDNKKQYQPSLNNNEPTRVTYEVAQYLEVKKHKSPEGDGKHDWIRFDLDSTKPNFYDYALSIELINEDSGSNITLSGVATDTQSIISSVQYRVYNDNDVNTPEINWQEMTPVDGQYDEKTEEFSENIDLSILSDDRYTIRVRVFDASENKQSGIDKQVVIDRTAPIITNIKVNPEVSGKIAGEVIVTFDVIEAGTGFDEGYCYVKFVDNNDFESPYTEQESGSYKCVNTANNSYQAVVNTRDFVREGYLGTYNLKFRFRDLANNNRLSKPKKYLIDNKALGVPTTGSPHDVYQTSNDFWFTWSDESNGEAGVTYEFQSSSSPLEENGILTNVEFLSTNYQGNPQFYPLTTPTIHSTGARDATWYWQVRSVDEVGNKSAWSEIWNVTVDTQAPNAPKLNSPADTTVMKGDSTFYQRWEKIADAVEYEYESCNVDPDDDGIADCKDSKFKDTYTKPEKKVTPQPNSHFWWRVRARDAAGNWSSWSESYELTIDNDAPVISWDNDQDLITNDSTPNLTGKANDSYLAGIDQVKYQIKDQSGTILRDWIPANYNEGSFSFSPAELADGEYLIRVQAIDNAGNKSNILEKEVIIDNAHPSSLINLPEGSSEIVSESEGSEITAFNNLWNGELTGTATDNEGVANVQLSIQRTAGSDNYYWDGSAWIAGSGDEVKFALNPTDAPAKNVDWQYRLPAEHVKDGVTYVIRSHAEDVAGNVESTHQLTIIVDKTIPEVELTINPAAPDGKNSWYVTRPTITLTVTDENFDSLQYKWDDGSWESVAEKTVSTQVPSEGSHVLYYSAFDKANNFSATEKGIKSVRWDETGLDEGPQSIKVNPNPTSGTTAEVSWGKAHDNVNVDKYQIEWRLNDSDTRHSKTVNSTTFSTEIDQLTEGTWQVKVTAFDAVGNSKSASKELIVDRSAPAAPIVTLISTGEGSAFLGWTEIEDAANYLIFYGTTSGEHIYGANVGQVTEYEVQGLGAGSYYFVVRAMDAAHNQSDNSNEVNTGQIAGAAGVEPGAPATDFAPAGEVQGVSTDEAVMAAADGDNNGEVLGTTQELNNWLQQRLPWVLLATQLLLLLLIENVLKREPGLLKHLLSIIVTLVVIALAVLLINPSQYQAGTMLRLVADWYIPAAIALLILVKAYSYAFIEEVG